MSLDGQVQRDDGVAPGSVGYGISVHARGRVGPAVPHEAVAGRQGEVAKCSDTRRTHYRQRTISGIYLIIEGIGTIVQRVGECVRTTSCHSLTTRHIGCESLITHKVGIQHKDAAVGERIAIIYLRAIRTDEGDAARCNRKSTPFKSGFVVCVVQKVLHGHARTKRHILSI